MEKGIVSERPSRVTLALCLLYLDLGISVIRVAVPWLRVGVPGVSGFLLINVLIMVATTVWIMNTMSPAQFPTWIWLVGVVSIAITPVAIWLYYMIGKGRNWARIIILVMVILEALVFTLGMAPSLYFSSEVGHSNLSVSALLTRPPTLQMLLKIIAVALLYGRVSSDWFKAG
jgi:hypothetical protein